MEIHKDDSQRTIFVPLSRFDEEAQSQHLLLTTSARAEACLRCREERGGRVAGSQSRRSDKRRSPGNRLRSSTVGSGRPCRHFAPARCIFKVTVRRVGQRRRRDVDLFANPTKEHLVVEFQQGLHQRNTSVIVSHRRVPFLVDRDQDGLFPLDRQLLREKDTVQQISDMGKQHLPAE